MSNAASAGCLVLTTSSRRPLMTAPWRLSQKYLPKFVLTSAHERDSLAGHTPADKAVPIQRACLDGIDRARCAHTDEQTRYSARSVCQRGTWLNPRRRARRHPRARTVSKAIGRIQDCAKRELFRTPSAHVATGPTTRGRSQGVIVLASHNKTRPRCGCTPEDYEDIVFRVLYRASGWLRIAAGL